MKQKTVEHLKMFEAKYLKEPADTNKELFDVKGQIFVFSCTTSTVESV